MPFQIIRNDITKVRADAIVNTANPQPMIGGGTDSAIYAAAGEKELLVERKKIGKIQPGQAMPTDAFKLQAKYIIHTVGPSWIDGQHGERAFLHSCYENSLNLAAKLQCESVAFPLIATGVYQFPKDEALQIALFEINKFLLSHEMEVILVVFDRKAFELSSKLSGSIREFIDENSVQNLGRQEYGDLLRVQKRRFSSKGGARTFWESGFSKPVKKSIKDVKSVTLASSDLPRRETTRGTIAYRKNRELGKPSTHD